VAQARGGECAQDVVRVCGEGAEVQTESVGLPAHDGLGRIGKLPSFRLILLMEASSRHARGRAELQGSTLEQFRGGEDA